MDMETQGLGADPLENNVSNEGYMEGSIDVRSKTSLRMHYEAQVSVLRRQMGDLESIRLGLGLSQRKMSQLLMVDPSSWTRWTKQGDEAPPHVWRALQWYSILNEKIPGLTPQYFMNQSPQVLHQKALQELESEKAERQAEMSVLSRKLDGFSAEKSALNAEVAKLKKDLKFHRKISIFILSMSLVWAAVFLVWKFI
jgi:transcriptional regulator with XRE-family HTH domain